MKPLALLIAAVCIFSCVDAEARIFKRRSRVVVRQRYSAVQKTATQKSSIQKSDQARAQQKANTLAARGVLSHMGYFIGMEGIGYGTSRYCATCVYRGRLTADAAAQGRGGVWYRVRVWR